MAENNAQARWMAAGIAGALGVLALILGMQDNGTKQHRASEDAGLDAADEAGSADAGSDPFALLDAGESFGLEQIGNTTSEREDRLDSGVGARFADGTPVPPLPKEAPRAVRFGVILVAYTGAQDAPRNTRSKDEARAMAEKLAAEAKTDFRAAVKQGDPGSSDDLGRITRGTLELAPEYTLFTLAAGQTSEPIDTPRGFWIVKRID